jgi:hypothetical protein
MELLVSLGPKLAVELKMHTSKEYGNIIERVGLQLAQKYFNHCSI